MPSMAVVERDYPNTYKKFTSLGPLLEKLGNGSKGINWSMGEAVELLRGLNRTVLDEGVSKGQPRILTDIHAIETVLTLAPETNGEVAVKAGGALGKATGRAHDHRAPSREEEEMRVKDPIAQRRKRHRPPTEPG